MGGGGDVKNQNRVFHAFSLELGVNEDALSARLLLCILAFFGFCGAWCSEEEELAEAESKSDK